MGIINDVELNQLKEIFNEKGNVLHALKSTDYSFKNFGEAYFSFVNANEIKGWKKHTEMILNIIVPIGAIRFILFDDRETSSTYKNFMDVTLGQQNYQRITVPPGVFMAFQGKGLDRNMLLNIASIPHDPSESINLELPKIEFSW